MPFHFHVYCVESLKDYLSNIFLTFSCLSIAASVSALKACRFLINDSSKMFLILHLRRISPKMRCALAISPTGLTAVNIALEYGYIWVS